MLASDVDMPMNESEIGVMRAVRRFLSALE